MKTETTNLEKAIACAKAQGVRCHVVQTGFDRFEVSTSKKGVLFATFDAQGNWEWSLLPVVQMTRNP